MRLELRARSQNLSKRPSGYNSGTINKIVNMNKKHTSIVVALASTISEPRKMSKQKCDLKTSMVIKIYNENYFQED